MEVMRKTMTMVVAVVMKAAVVVMLVLERW